MEVSNFDQHYLDVLKYLDNRRSNFGGGGCISSCLPLLKNLTKDPEIFQMVTGLKIEFNTTLFQMKGVTNYDHVIDVEIAHLLSRRVTNVAPKEIGDYISPIFLRAKKDGTFKMVLNLKSLTAFVTYHHFKMDTDLTAINIMKPNCFVVTIDLKDACYFVPIFQDHQKLLKFSWKGQYYKFTAFPYSLALCPRNLRFLRSLGHLSVAYIDDLYLQGDTYEECLQNAIDTIQIFDKLGLIVHPKKSVFKPVQSITFLGFVLDLVKMRVYLTSDRAASINNACSNLLKNPKPSLRGHSQRTSVKKLNF